MIYVDDIIITRTDETDIRKLKDFLGTSFQTKDLGALKYFLDNEVLRSKKGIFLAQRKYVIHFLKEIGLLGAKLVKTPVVRNIKLLPNGGEILHDPE